MSDIDRSRPQPVATYRLQLHAGFTFGDAAAAVPYLAELGISHLYLSPIQQAVPGSTHGYDQCDPTRVSDELGGETGFRQLSAAARAHGLGIVLDIVPNHMATHPSNPWWWELLRTGREGRAGVYFDVDWDSPDPGLKGRVMLPVLAAPLAEVMQAGELTLVALEEQVALAYQDLRFPLADPGGHRAGDPVTAGLLDRQNYRLAFWRDASDHLNYRRFFDINSLVALREEDPAVFVTVHALPLQLVQSGDVQGLRVDHVDGLWDPAGYLEMLRRRAPGAWLLVEKILEPGEQLPPGWPVDGTTGYDFIHRLQGVFIDPAGEADLTSFYAEFTGRPASFAETVTAAKLEAAGRLFRPDLARLERMLARASRIAAEHTSAARTAAISQVGAHLSVYRNYLSPASRLAEADRYRVAAAVEAAAAGDGAPPRLVAALGDVLLTAGDDPTATEFAMRFQQFSGPLMAKGVEDTAFYRYNRLVCLNEVGGDPGSFGVTPAEFHSANQVAAERYPSTMLASSTHDTKRSEDVRARLSLLAQLPAEWSAAVRRWSAQAERYRHHDLPDRNAEYLLYQILVGAWPLSAERALAYMEKAVREAKEFTSWTDPDGAYEGAVRGFVSGVIADPAIQADMAAFVAPLVAAGRRVSLAQALVKLTAPGVPDIYQGTEAWDLSLVDPDNRRPVDYDSCRRLLAQPPGGADGSLDDAGLAKLQVVARALGARRRFPAAFGAGGTYTPVAAGGVAADNVLAYARGTTDDPFMVVVVVPRLTACAPPVWSHTSLALPAGSWSPALWPGSPVAGPDVDLDELLGRYPVVLLERTP